MIQSKTEIEFTLADLPKISELLWPYIQQHKIVAWYGEMGAGKTTLIKALCQAIDVQDNVSSPTFAIINEYKSRHGPIFHMDWYRLKDEEEARNAGIEDTLYNGAICFVEWPEKASKLLPDNTLNIYLSVISQDKRKLKYSI